MGRASRPSFRALTMIDLVVATTNPHKLSEIGAVLAPLGVRALGLNEVALPGGGRASELPEPVEDAATFAGNAAIKARFYACATGHPCLADDSGLEVDALGGAPGVLSARYACVGATRAERDKANNEKLVRELQGMPREKRTARFVCAMCLAGPDGTVLAESRGEFAGVIIDTPRGVNGFGYDPLLELPDGRTSAELSPDEKNTRSHRGEATRKIAEAIRARIASH